MPVRWRSGQAGHPFRFLVVGNAVSSYGTYLNLVALNLFALETTGSALSVGVFLLIRIASSFLAGFASGRLVVRFPRKYLMIGGDLCQAVALGCFALSPDGVREPALYVLAAVMGGCSTLSGVALRSSVPDIVGQDQRVRANGQLVTGRSLAMVLGFASAGPVVAWSGYTAAFLLDGGSFLVSATALAFLPLRASAAREEPAATGPDGAAREESDAAAAGGTSAGRRWAAGLRRYGTVVLCLVAVRAVDNMGSASHQVGLPVYAAQIDEDGAAAFVGRFFAAWAVGCVLAHQMVSRLRVVSRWAGGRHPEGGPGGERAFAVGTCLMSGFFILAFTGLPLPALLVVAAAAGIADGFTEIVYNSRLQALPEVLRGRLLGMAAMAETAALGTGTVLCAWLLDRYAPLSVAALAHGTVIALALAFLVALIAVPALVRDTGRRGPPEGQPADASASPRVPAG